MKARHLRRLPRALSPNHDENHGSASRHTAHRDRLGSQRRSVTTTRIGHRGRFATVAISDALTDADGLLTYG